MTMGRPSFNDDLRRDAVGPDHRTRDPVAEVSERLSVSRHSLYAWKRQLAQEVSGDASKDAADPTVEARTGPGDQGPTSRKSESQPYAYRMLHYFREPKLPIPMSRQSCGRNKNHRQGSSLGAAFS